nr:NAD(P)/FAD-dependent oxidoreductase [Saprospiraceae bacterium]
MDSESKKIWDVIVIGGGLAGLSLATLLSRSGVEVLVLEKENYPRHKVCGEFISNESRDFLLGLGLDIPSMELPEINRFELSFPNGKIHPCPLKPGGFGLSRWTLDHRLYQLAMQSGSEVVTDTRVTQIEKTDEGPFEIQTSDRRIFRGKIAIGSTGRYSGSLFHSPSPSGGSVKKYFGLKYHVASSLPDELIQINLFPGGYAGISKIESDKHCFCYLADSKSLKKCNGSVARFEKEVLSKNPVIKKHLEENTVLEGPITTSHFVFDYHRTVNRPYLLMGDTAGFIPPLTGNGMSLAFRSASVLSQLLLDHFHRGKTLEWVKREYRQYGDNYLKKRIRSGVFLQNLALHPGPVIQKTLSAGMTLLPFLLTHLSRKASGKKF